MNSVAVIDYGMGNLRAVVKAIEHVAPRARVRLTSSAEEGAHAGRVVFPGQGAIGACMPALDTGHLRAAVLQAAQTKPFLGICLRLPALHVFCVEGGGGEGLGVLPGRRVTVPTWPALPSTDYGLPLRPRAPEFLPCSSIPRRARRPV